ncbi:hypothetical protein KC660_00435 [Candidatus Dojkabacteria bacterium]|uniref:ArsR family transcriptional regulator n=1 Tax=Candidatus Dojkabacteria bacterium TaxID=2099670 RepID=A0A955L2S7_9BACT|nr:hypothetical protein [Candidatus Dojkabacteria bacterium]
MKTLEYFFISKVRIKILNLYFFDPEEAHHVRGVVRKVDEEINAVRRELVRMEKAKLLKSEKRGNRLYYVLRKDFKFYPEFFSLVHKSFGLGKAISSNRAKIGNVSFAILTGDYMRNIKNPHDEVDLVVIGDVDIDSLNEVVKSQQEFVGREINYTVMSDDEFALRKKRNDVFVLSILRDQKIMLAGSEENLVN